MITAIVMGAYGKKDEYRVDRLANRGEWFGKTWFVGIGCGFDIHRVVVEADNESEVIDALTDSAAGHLIKVDEECPHQDPDQWDQCNCTFAGNFSDRVDLDDIRILKRCKVKYFEPADRWLDIS